jgi:hypothetical protein
MNRRQFLQGLAATVGGYTAARFMALEIGPHAPAIEVQEAILLAEPVTRTSPLAYVDLDGVRFPMLECQFDRQIESKRAWSADCIMAADWDLEALHRVSMRVGQYPIVIHPYGMDKEIFGEGMVSHLSHSFNRQGRIDARFHIIGLDEWRWRPRLESLG